MSSLTRARQAQRCPGSRFRNPLRLRRNKSLTPKSTKRKEWLTFGTKLDQSFVGSKTSSKFNRTSTSSAWRTPSSTTVSRSLFVSKTWMMWLFQKPVLCWCSTKKSLSLRRNYSSLTMKKRTLWSSPSRYTSHLTASSPRGGPLSWSYAWSMLQLSCLLLSAL